MRSLVIATFQVEDESMGSSSLFRVDVELFRLAGRRVDWAPVRVMMATC
jgi:hypothetical protein